MMETKITLTLTADIPQFSEEGFKEELEQWLKSNFPDIIENILDNHFEDRLLEWYNDEYEPEKEELSELGKITLSIKREKQ